MKTPAKYKVWGKASSMNVSKNVVAGSSVKAQRRLKVYHDVSTWGVPAETIYLHSGLQANCLSSLELWIRMSRTQKLTDSCLMQCAQKLQKWQTMILESEDEEHDRTRQLNPTHYGLNKPMEQCTFEWEWPHVLGPQYSNRKCLEDS